VIKQRLHLPYTGDMELIKAYINGLFANTTHPNLHQINVLSHKLFRLVILYKSEKKKAKIPSA